MMMAKIENAYDHARELVDLLQEAAKEILEEADSAVCVMEGSDEWLELKQTAWLDFHWLSKLPADLRRMVRVVWSVFERLGPVLKIATGEIEPEEKRKRIEGLLDEVLGHLGRAVRPLFYEVKPRGELTEAQSEKVREEADHLLAASHRRARLDVLDEQADRLRVVIEEIEAEVPSFSSVHFEEASAPRVEAETLDEIEGLLKRGEGPYIRLVEGLPLKKVKGMKLGRHPLLPAHTPPWCFDWDAAERTTDQVSALGEVRSHYGRLKRLLEQALGVRLGIPRPRNLEAPPELQRASMVVHQCDEALMWLGTTLPVGERAVHVHGGFSSADHLRAFMLAKVEFCFSELRDAVDQLRSGLAEAEAQAEAEKRVAAAPSEGEDHVFTRQGDFWRLVFDGKEAIVKHLLGNVYIAEVLRNPQKPISAAALCALGTKREDPPRGGPTYKVSDKEALVAYRNEWTELNRRMDEAKRNDDMAAQERIAQELADLAERVKKDAALGGRAREFPDDKKRARSSVAHAIRKSLRAIKEVHTPLWQHLKAHLHTGASVRYTPDGHIVWQT